MPTRMHKSLNVVITGVTRGLGLAMVDEFARRGHRVFGCGRTTRVISALCCKHPDHDFQSVDVAVDEEVKTWAARLLAKHTGPDVLLNNAAVINPKEPLWKVSEQEFSTQIDINIKGVANVIRHFAPSMINRGSGIIVNFGSRWATHVEPEMAAYCTSKAAVRALTRVLAQELRPWGVAAVVLNPGIIRTDMLRRYLGDDLADIASYPTPEEWASVAVPFIERLGLTSSGRLRRVPVSQVRQLSRSRQLELI